MIAKRQDTQGAQVPCVRDGGVVLAAGNQIEKRSKKLGARSRRLIAAVTLGALMAPGAAMLASASKAVAAEEDLIAAKTGAMSKMDQSLATIAAQQQAGAAARSL